MTKRYVTVRQYAAAYGVSIATVYAMCAVGKLPHVRLGTGRGTIRISEDATAQEGGKEDGLPDTPVASVKTPRVKVQRLRTPSRS